MFLPFYEFLSIDNKYRKIILLFLLLFQGHRHGNQIIATSQEHLNLRLIQSDQVLDLSWEIVWISVSCLLYTSPSPRDKRQSRMPSSA